MERRPRTVNEFDATGRRSGWPGAWSAPRARASQLVAVDEQQEGPLWSRSRDARRPSAIEYGEHDARRGPQ